jgi:hypothetical protein
MKISQIFRLKSSYIQTQTRILSMWVLGKKTNDIDVYARPCLPRDWLGFVKSPKFFFSKSTSIFLLFISHQSLFITFQIKKSLQNKKFHFSIQNILTFSSYQSNLLQYQSTSSNPIPSQTQPY